MEYGRGLDEHSFYHLAVFMDTKKKPLNKKMINPMKEKKKLRACIP